MAEPTAPARPPRRRDRRLAAHLGALALVLLALVPLVGPGASFSADEGAAIVQARSLARGEGWIVEHPVPEADPTGANYPLENSKRGEQGVAPYAKHPLYPVLLAGAGRMGGVAGMVVLSLAGTLVAAGLSALLARRIDGALERPALWVVGLGSPLLFDGFLVVGHALGAALAVGAALLALRAVETRRLAPVSALVPVVAAGTMLRTEFALFAVALAAAVAVGGLVVRRPAMPALVSGVSLAATLAGRAADRAWSAGIVGPVDPALPQGGALASGGLAGRVRGLVITWLTPAYDPGTVVYLALLVMVAAVVAGAVVVRRRPGERRAVAGTAVVALTSAIVALASAPANVVPGLLVAFPVAAAGLALLRRQHLATAAGRLALLTAGLFALGVVATQYQRGGSGEWGGRYFAIGLAVVTPVLLQALRDGGRRLAPQARRIAGAALAGCMVALSVMGIAALRSAHQRNASMNAAVHAAAVTAGRTRAVVVAADGALARHGWPSFDDARWLLAGPDLAGLAGRLRAAGVAEFVYVTRDSGGPGGALRVVSRRSGGDGSRRWHVLVVRVR